jgi:hypothetical protein
MNLYVNESQPHSHNVRQFHAFPPPHETFPRPGRPRPPHPAGPARRCRQTNQELAALVHASPPTCLRRVKRLVEAGVIARQVALLTRHSSLPPSRPWWRSPWTARARKSSKPSRPWWRGRRRCSSAIGLAGPDVLVVLCATCRPITPWRTGSSPQRMCATCAAISPSTAASSRRPSARRDSRGPMKNGRNLQVSAVLACG